MTAHWFIIRTAPRHEREVAAAISEMGFEAWLPLEIRWRGRRKNRQPRLWDGPALPATLFAAIPVAAHGDLQRVRYYDAIGRDAASLPVSVPYSQLSKFMASLDKHNAKIREAYERATQGRPKIKPQRFKLDPALRETVMGLLFGQVLGGEEISEAA